VSYIGNGPVVGAFKKCDAITTSSTATYNLTVSSVAVIPQSANHCIVSLNGVIQAPTSAFTVAGSTIVFNSSLTSSDVVDFILILGDVLNVGVPSDDSIDSNHYVDGSIDTAHIADDQITLAKMAAGTDGQIITYDASGNPAAVGPGTDGQVLTSTGAGSPPAFEAAAAGGSLTYLAGVTASNQTVTFDGHFTSDYTNYIIYYTNVIPAADNKTLGMRVRVSSSDQTGSSYWGSADGNRRASGANTDTSAGGSGETVAHLTWNESQSSTVTYPSSGQITLFGPLSTSSYKFYEWTYNANSSGASPTYFISLKGGGFYPTTSALTGVSFSFDTFGTNVSAGTFHLYGIKNS